MSVQQASMVSSLVKRPLADYPPSFWGDQFLNYHFDEIAHARKEQEVEKLREEARRVLLECADDAMQQLDLIDEIQRLCVEHHFEAEINEALERLYAIYQSNDDDNDLYSVSLRFRLLRQQGCKVSTEIFKKFKDEKGNFQESLTTDVRGMLSLYDASQLRLRGEDILDEALAFTTTQLNKSLHVASTLSPCLEAQVRHALEQQLRKNLPRLEAKHYMMYIYPYKTSHNKSLLKLAKLTFNLLQSMHRKELSILARYWKDLGLVEKAYFARNRLVECYFWSVGIYPQPENCLARRILTKTIAITTVIDDVYDAYGLLEELELFTEAFKRWDIKCIDQLPEEMKPGYEAILDLFKEIEDEMEKQGKLYRAHYAKESYKSLMRGYLKEAQWFNKKYIPTVEEHRELSLVTCTYPTLITLAYVGMGEIVTKETFDWMLTNPKIVEASSIVSRFMDDIVGHKFEQGRGHVASGVECYVKQYKTTEEEAYKVFNELVINGWKDLNEECLEKEMPMPILEISLNFARVMDVLYKAEDSFTLVGDALIKAVTSMLVDPVPDN